MANEVEEGADKATMQATVDRCRALKTEFDARHDYWVKDLPDGTMKQIKTVDCYEPAIEFHRVLNGEFIPACLAGDSAKVRELSRGSLRQYYETHRSAVDDVVVMATERNAADEAEVSAIVRSRTTWSAGATFGVLALIAGFGWFTVRETVRPLKKSSLRLQQLSAQELTSVGQRLRQNAESTSDQAMLASGAAEEVSANAQSLASAVSQFEASIKEIAGNASNAAGVARNAVTAAGQTTATITRLGESSQEISNVIKVINSIAEQTNLLALNATIEAARAGEAGKGFAVVANEVKELAKETSKATEDIIRRVEAIQSDTLRAVDAIGQVSAIISEINESQNAIAGAVEEQTAMTSEISRNISEVATGSGEIARNISLVADAAKGTTTGSDETLATARDIQEMAAELMKLVGQTAEASVRQEQKPTPPAMPASKGKYQLNAAREVSFAESV